MTRAGATISAVLDKASGALTATSSGGSLDDVSGVSSPANRKINQRRRFLLEPIRFPEHGSETENPYGEFPK